MKDFQLCLFSIDQNFIKTAEAAGIDNIIVDWENKGKIKRQKDADTEINNHGLVELKKVRASFNKTVICRINETLYSTDKEKNDVIESGADEILLPMVRRVDEIEKLLNFINGRCRVGILIETTAILNQLSEVAQLPLSRVYVGLNDLEIERKTGSIFSPLIDGTLKKIRAHFRHMPFGFGGLTLPDCGSPIPCRLLMSEMIKYKSDFTFLRRSFYRDLGKKNPIIEVPKILNELINGMNKTAEDFNKDYAELTKIIKEICQKPSKGESLN